MATKICTICGKKADVGGYYVKLRGKFNPTKAKKRYPNLQWMRLASGKRVLACTKCMKAKTQV